MEKGGPGFPGTAVQKLPKGRNWGDLKKKKKSRGRRKKKKKKTLRLAGDRANRIFGKGGVLAKEEKRR